MWEYIFTNSAETRKIKYPQSILQDTTRENCYREKNRKVNGLQNSPTKKKNVVSFLCREYLSLENIHQVSQLQLPRFISFFPLDVRIYPKFFLILVNYFFIFLNLRISNVTFLYSLKRLNLKVCWCFQGISKYNNGKIWVKSMNFYHTIRFQISLMKSITLLLKSLVGSYVTFGNWMFFQNNQNKTLLTLSTF